MSHKLRLFLIVPALLAGPFTGLGAYLPLRYSPLDSYVERPAAGGPKKVLVREAGKVIATAILEYDSTGRLLKEVYQRAEGRGSGTTLYIYDGTRLAREETRDAKGVVTTVKEFAYGSGGLDRMLVRDPAGTTLIEQRFTSRQGKIQQAKQVIGGDEQFLLEYTDGRPTLLRVLRDDGKEIGRIAYRYGAGGRVEERIREQGDRKERCRYTYDRTGRLDAYVYEEPQGKGWKEIRRIELVY